MHSDKHLNFISINLSKMNVYKWIYAVCNDNSYVSLQKVYMKWTVSRFSWRCIAALEPSAVSTHWTL